MYWVYSSLLWTFIILLPPFFLIISFKMKTHSSKLPPGPPGWPVFGHMFKLGTEPHKSIAALREDYGPVVWLKLGSTNTMVILTAKAAAEFFKNHDHHFADRRIVETMRAHDFHERSLTFAPYGSYWRMLRRLCTEEMFTQKKINDAVSIRRKCVDDLLVWIEKEVQSVNQGVGIHVVRFVLLASFNVMGNLMLSRDLAYPNSELGSEFFTALMGALEWLARPNISDLFGYLKWFDLQGLKRKADRDVGRVLEIASAFVEERMKEKREGKQEKRKDFLDILLDFEGNGADESTKLSKQSINIFIMEMFIAGTSTTSNSIEWALTELLRHPEEMTKLKAEINKIVEPNKKLEETDIENLPYLHAVVKETIRLHPPVPFLVPRQAIEDVSFMGYHIPKNTQVFINAWAIGRDEEFWNEASSFKPERFLGSKVDYKGQHFEFLPFGAGRRICVGLPQAHRTLHFILGSLIHEFDWVLENKTVDMREKLAMTVRKLEPLRAIPRKRGVL